MLIHSTQSLNSCPYDHDNGSATGDISNSYTTWSNVLGALKRRS